MTNIYKQFLVNNISCLPKDIANLVKDYLFYDHIESKQRKCAARLISSLIFNKQTIHMPWYYDDALNIFVGSSVMVFIKIRCIYNINKFNVLMCLTFCELCGNYMECDSMDTDDIPLHIKCRC